MTDRATIIIVHETILQSWGRDLGVFALFVGLIGLGVYLESRPMQWAGFLVACVSILSLVSDRAERVTIPEARAILDRLEHEFTGTELEDET